MEIRDVETLPVGTPAPHKGGVNFLFVKVVTADGTVGYGECPWVEYRLETMQQLIAELKDGFVVGSSPFEIERLRRRLYNSNHSLNVPGPLQAQAIASIEMACWDIVGKTVGEPVYNLLGGRVNDRIRSYTYLHYEWSPPDPPAAAADVAEAYLDRGFTGVKLDPIPPYEGPREASLAELEYAENVVAAIRDRVGTACDVIIGTHGQLTTADAIRFANRLEEYDPLWFEEPVPAERADEMATVAEATEIPIATGERLTTLHQASELLERRGVDVLQPNLGFTGILNAKKIAGMAEAHYAQIAPWLYCGPIQWAANPHLDATCPNLLIQEAIEDWEGFHGDLLVDPPTFEDGGFAPPAEPGLGVELDEAVVEANPPNEMSPDEFSWF
jgi:2-dehydro-3-deoxyphosphogalactonate aldolase